MFQYPVAEECDEHLLPGYALAMEARKYIL
jgi:hypothetical protein